MVQTASEPDSCDFTTKRWPRSTCFYFFDSVGISNSNNKGEFSSFDVPTPEAWCVCVCVCVAAAVQVSGTVDATERWIAYFS